MTRLRWLPMFACALACAALCACTDRQVSDSCPGAQTPPACACTPDSQGGAVVVRWRALDIPAGQYFARGQCCCAPGDEQSVGQSGCQCGNTGSSCTTSAPWLIANVQLHVTPQSAGASVGGSHAECVITAKCLDGELTTDFCLAGGTSGEYYDLLLTAEIATLDTPAGQPASFAFHRQQAVVPPAVRRMVEPGQIVNLDAVVLGINAPRVPDGGPALPADGGVDAGGDAK